MPHRCDLPDDICIEMIWKETEVIGAAQIYLMLDLGKSQGIRIFSLYVVPEYDSPRSRSFQEFSIGLEGIVPGEE
jgi:hypothetical protein